MLIDLGCEVGYDEQCGGGDTENPLDLCFDIVHDVSMVGHHPFVGLLFRLF